MLPPTSGSRMRLAIARDQSNQNSRRQILIGDCGLESWRTSAGIRTVTSCNQDQVWLGQRRGDQASTSPCPLALENCALSEVGKAQQIAQQAKQRNPPCPPRKQHYWYWSLGRNGASFRFPTFPRPAKQASHVSISNAQYQVARDGPP